MTAMAASTSQVLKVVFHDLNPKDPILPPLKEYKGSLYNYLEDAYLGLENEPQFRGVGCNRGAEQFLNYLFKKKFYLRVGR